MADFLLLMSILSIWISVTESIVIMAGAIRFINKQEKKGFIFQRVWIITQR